MKNLIKTSFVSVFLIFIYINSAYSQTGIITHTCTKTEYTFLNNLITQVKVIEEGDNDSLTDDRTTITKFAHNTTDWLIGLPYEKELIDASNDGVSKQRIYYDNEGLGTVGSKGLVTKQESWLNLPQEQWLDALTEYDNYGNVIKTTDARGNSIATAYESTLHQYPATITNEFNHTQQFTYDFKTGQILTSTDPNGKTTTNQYDSLGRLIKIFGPLDNDGYASVIYEYNLITQPVRITKKVKKDYGVEDYIITYTFLDGFGRVIQVRSPAEPDNNGIPRQIISGYQKYDHKGQVKESYDSYFDNDSSSYTTPRTDVNKVSYTYDCLGRQLSVTSKNEAGEDIQSTNSYSGRSITSTDPNSKKKKSSYDAFGNLIKVEEYNDNDTYTTVYDYDTLGNLTTVTDTLDNITTITYDSLGRKISMDDPDMGEWHYTYDANGNLLTQTDAKSQVISFIYDKINRVKTKQTPDNTVSYTYDQGLNGLGRLNSVTYTGGSTQFYYDELGREIKSIKTIDNASYTVERTYDAMDRLKNLKYPDNETLTYSYNTGGAIKKIKGLTDTYVSKIIYNEAGQMTSLEYGNGAVTTYTYNPYTRRLSHLLTQKDNDTIQNLLYTFDNVGNVLSITDNIYTATQNFQYDDLYRLVYANNASGYGTINYAYDAIGNIKQKGPMTLTYGEGTAGPHAVTSYQLEGQTVPITYDANGNMLNKGGVSYSYNAENRLIEAHKPPQTYHETFKKDLKAGWNFIHIPLIPSNGWKIDDVLSSLTIGADYDQISRFNPATQTFESYVNRPEYNQFDTFEYLRGYQIYCLRDCTLEINGTYSQQAEDYELQTGQNILGVDVSKNGTTAAVAFFGLPYTSIHTYNPVTQTTEEISTNDIVTTGNSYWVRCSESATYSVNLIPDQSKFMYDGDGGRVKMTSRHGTTYYIGSLFEKRNGKTTRHIFLGDTRICSVDATSLSYFHGDHLGSTSNITDNEGTVVQHTEYKPYGEFSPSTEVSDDNVTPYLYTGKHLDVSTDLYYYGARYYDPQLGRFITADTIVPNPSNPQAFNRYGYAYNNPINYTDPTGHFSLKNWIGKIVGGVVGAFIGISTGQWGLAMQSYAYLSSMIDTAIGIANGVDPGRAIGSFFATSAINMMIPGGDGSLAQNVGLGLIRGSLTSAVDTAIMGGDESDIGRSALIGGSINAGIGVVVGLFNGKSSTNQKQEVQQYAQNAVSKGQIQNAIDNARYRGGSGGGFSVTEAVFKAVQQPASVTNNNGNTLSRIFGCISTYIDTVSETGEISLKRMASVAQSLSFVLSDAGILETSGEILGGVIGSTYGGFWGGIGGAEYGGYLGKVADYEWDLDWRWVKPVGVGSEI